MPSMQNAVNNHEYRAFPSPRLRSQNQSRKRFDAKSLEELAAHVPGHISRLLCRWSFCGRERPVASREGEFSFPKGT